MNAKAANKKAAKDFRFDDIPSLDDPCDRARAIAEAACSGATTIYGKPVEWHQLLLASEIQSLQAQSEAYEKHLMKMGAAGLINEHGNLTPTEFVWSGDAEFSIRYADSPDSRTASAQIAATYVRALYECIDVVAPTMPIADAMAGVELLSRFVRQAISVPHLVQS